MHPRLGASVAFVVVLGHALGCGGAPSAWSESLDSLRTRSGTAEERAATITAARNAWTQRGEAGYALRAARGFSDALAIDPADPALWEHLAEALLFAAEEATADGRDPLALYTEAARAAERALRQRAPEAATRLREGATFDTVVEHVPNDGSTALLLRTEAALAIHDLRHTTQTDAVSLVACARRLVALRRDARANRSLAIVLTRLPSYAGGNLAEAEQAFEEALSDDPNDLRTRLYYALDYAWKIQDPDLFNAQLQAMDAVATPTPESALARRRLHSINLAFE